MADVDTNSVPVIAITAAVGAVVLLLVLLCGLGRRTSEEEETDSEKEKQNSEVSSHKTSKPDVKKKEKQSLKKRETRPTFTHPWLSTSFKSHSSPVLDLDFSPNGKYLVSCAEDRCVMLWNTKDFTKRDHKCVRANVELDHATQVKFSPDSKALILSLYNANVVRVMKLGKKDDGSLGNFQTVLEFSKHHDEEIRNIGISSTGKFIMTCSRDTNLKILDLKGEVLATINTNQMKNAFSTVSPCGRFVGSSGFTPDVKVWEILFDKGGSFKEVKRAFDLKGHTAGVYSFAFSTDSHRMATVSKDGTWKLWDTNVEYQLNQDPYLLKTGEYPHQGDSVISLAPNASTIAIGSGNTITLYNCHTAQCDATIKDAHSFPIRRLAFDSTSQFLLTTGDKNIHVFHNITGYQAIIDTMEAMKITARNAAHKERCEEQIIAARNQLAALQPARS